MCGICGIFQPGERGPIDRALLTRMTERLVRRGPDASGYLYAAGVGLGMRRLSIVDRSGGDQPIYNEDGSVGVVFNGEIYNHVALRDQLEKQGHRFATRSDTEVLVHLYEEHGDELVHLLDGMFAFAIYDGRIPDAPRLFIARDRLGKKPLYYAPTPRGIVFGSELKSVLPHPDVSRELDVEALHHYLSLLVVPAPLSIYRGVRKLSAGHRMVVDGNGIRVSRYFDPLDEIGDERPDEREAVTHIRGLLDRAVEKRFMGEVPVGAFLSGGLDSSAVVALMARDRQRLMTFSVGFAGPETHNELPAARLVAKHVGTEHHEILVQPDMLALLPDLVSATDEPFAISSAIPTLMLSRAVARDATVVLTGDGGDEVFGGYAHYLFERWAAVYREVPARADVLFSRAAKVLQGLPAARGQAHRVGRFVANARGTVAERRLGWASGFGDHEKRSMYAQPERFRHVPSTADFVGRLLDSRGMRLSPDTAANVIDTMLFLPDEMLAKVDRMTMYASIEARCPLLDRDLMKFVAGLSLRARIPGNGMSSLKHLLREAVRPLLPQSIVDGRKWGFNVPLAQWMRGDAGAVVNKRLSGDRVRRFGLFRAEGVRELLAAHVAGEREASNRVFALLVLDEWMDREAL